MDCTFISIISENEEEARKNRNALPGHGELAQLEGREVLIYVPPCGLPFSLAQIRKWLVSPAKVDMFNLELQPDGNYSRVWYEL